MAMAGKAPTADGLSMLVRMMLTAELLASTAHCSSTRLLAVERMLQLEELLDWQLTAEVIVKRVGLK